MDRESVSSSHHKGTWCVPPASDRVTRTMAQARPTSLVATEKLKTMAPGPRKASKANMKAALKHQRALEKEFARAEEASERQSSAGHCRMPEETSGRPASADSCPVLPRGLPASKSELIIDEGTVSQGVLPAAELLEVLDSVPCLDVSASGGGRCASPSATFTPTAAGLHQEGISEQDIPPSVKAWLGLMAYSHQGGYCR